MAFEGFKGLEMDLAEGADENRREDVNTGATTYLAPGRSGSRETVVRKVKVGNDCNGASKSVELAPNSIQHSLASGSLVASVWLLGGFWCMDSEVLAAQAPTPVPPLQPHRSAGCSQPLLMTSWLGFKASLWNHHLDLFGGHRLTKPALT